MTKDQLVQQVDESFRRINQIAEERMKQRELPPSKEIVKPTPGPYSVRPAVRNGQRVLEIITERYGFIVATIEPDDHEMRATAEIMAQSWWKYQEEQRSSHEPEVEEPSVMGGMLSQPRPPVPSGVDLIEWCVQQIQITCDAMNLDPAQWLNDSTAQGESSPPPVPAPKFKVGDEVVWNNLLAEQRAGTVTGVNVIPRYSVRPAGSPYLVDLNEPDLKPSLTKGAG